MKIKQLQSNFEKDQMLLIEFNNFRRNPQKILPFLNNRKANYCKDQNNNKKLLFSPHYPNKGVQTKQGVSIITQVIGQLYSHDKMNCVLQNQYLSQIAKSLANTLKNMLPNQIYLTPQIGKFLRAKLNQSSQYSFNQKVVCLIGIGFDKDQYQPLLSLLIDDGNQQRKNRQTLFNKDFKFVGIGSQKLIKLPELRLGIYLLTTKIGMKS